MIDEIVILVVSTLLIGFFAGWCGGMGDSTAYDMRAERLYLENVKSDDEAMRESLLAFRPQFTRYSIGEPNDFWHIVRRSERYGTYSISIITGALLGLSWWLAVAVVCHLVAGLIGFNLGDKWKGSMWLMAIGSWWNRRFGQ